MCSVSGGFGCVVSFRDVGANTELLCLQFSSFSSASTTIHTTTTTTTTTTTSSSSSSDFLAQLIVVGCRVAYLLGLKAEGVGFCVILHSKPVSVILT